MPDESVGLPAFQYQPFQSNAALWLHTISGLLGIGFAVAIFMMFAKDRFESSVLLMGCIAIMLQCLARLWERVYRLTRQIIELEKRLNQHVVRPRPN